MQTRFCCFPFLFSVILTKPCFLLSFCENSGLCVHMSVIFMCVLADALPMCTRMKQDWLTGRLRNKSKEKRDEILREYGIVYNWWNLSREERVHGIQPLGKHLTLKPWLKNLSLRVQTYWMFLSTLNSLIQ